MVWSRQLKLRETAQQRTNQEFDCSTGRQGDTGGITGNPGAIQEPQGERSAAG